jgi:hypothetical protein
MAAGREKNVPPSIKLTAFNCPHCHVFTSQNWLAAHAEGLARNEMPIRVTAAEFAKRKFDDIKDPEDKAKVQAYFRKLSLGRPFLWRDTNTVHFMMPNVSVSVCYTCEEPTLWVADRIVWPAYGEAPAPNPDLPDEMRTDFEEAGAILDASPRGAAALLRLVIQKLCQHLGGKGERIADDIATLVRNGLDSRVQQALDVVRVIGNNAVHPGSIDLRDDRDTAQKLFGLVNLIVEIMISQPKHVKEMYESLPEGIRKAIEKRDTK